MKSITIILTDDNQLKVQASEPLNNQTLIDISLSTILGVMNQTVEDAPIDQRLEIKEHLFNTFNIAASTLLAQLAPDIDLRPDITEQALLDAELNIALNSNDNHELSNL